MYVEKKKFFICSHNQFCFFLKIGKKNYVSGEIAKNILRRHFHESVAERTHLILIIFVSPYHRSCCVFTSADLHRRHPDISEPVQGPARPVWRGGNYHMASHLLLYVFFSLFSFIQSFFFYLVFFL